MKHLQIIQMIGVFVVILAVAGHVAAQPLPHSFSRPDQVAVKHLHLELSVNFDTKQLTGTAELTLDRKSTQHDLRLDSNGLRIARITTAARDDLTWSFGVEKPGLGKLLNVALPPTGNDNADKVIIHYSTSPNSEALQWLSPEQTTDKQHPFLFTQSQAILARTWVPCQDTPAVRMTYSAKIEVPQELLPVMSASNPQKKNKTGVYNFKMKQPIPSYLLALAVGNLKFVAVGNRSGVYAEPSVLKRAAWELNDTERMIAAAEKLYGPYRWQRYDVIFLPSSFPFGGMENPRLTFATPTILAGDRSLVALIAHELAHSWSGNLVTNATWNDFWLNEGFTVYFEQRIMEAVYGRRYSEMLARLSLDGLERELADLDARDTWLKLDLAGRNPDDGMTAIAYDKGYFFLRTLEESVGREKWDVFLRAYFDKFAFQSMTTESFVKHLKANLATQINIDDWIYGPGLPDNAPAVETDELAKVEKAAQRFTAGESAKKIASDFSTENWTTHHWNYFLRSFGDKLTQQQMSDLDQQFKFTDSGNSEITHDWCMLAIVSNYQPAMTKLESFLTSQGRRKFLQPLYEKLAETDSGIALARKIYKRARPGYHSVSRNTIDEILDWKPVND
jgi:aminopeptidase N